MRRLADQKTRAATPPWVTELLGQGGVGRLSQMRPSGGGGSSVAALDDLTDVDTTGVADNDVLTYDSGTSTWGPAAGGGAPSTHHTTHEDGGGDEISVAGLSGLLADAQTPLGHHTSHEDGGADEVKVDDLPTVETETTKVLQPDGAGGVLWGDASGLPIGLGTAHHQYRFAMFSPPAGTSVYPLFEASAAMNVKKVRVIHTGSGSLNVNAIKNQRGTPSDVLTSDLASSSTAWQNAAATGGAVALTGGDEIDVRLASVAGFVEYVSVIVDTEEAL